MQILLEIFAVAVIAIFVAKRVATPTRGRALKTLKAWVTARAFWLLLAHPVNTGNGKSVAAWRLALDTVQGIDAGTFWTFLSLAAGIMLVGAIASMYRWILLLRGQAIELPFRHIFGSFLVGRFIGTFLPGSLGLDGYKLYDAARFSGKSVEVAATTALEKVIGFAGIFLAFLVALPFGIEIFGESARSVAWVALPVSLCVIATFMLALFYPGLVKGALVKLPFPGKPRFTGLVARLSDSVAAYRDQRVLVLTALALSFAVHFSKAAMFYFTALSIGAVGSEFWPIAFGPSLQILATTLSPFGIAGEGLREASQYAQLDNLIGPADAALSAALGLLAVNVLSLFGGFFWWTRGADYKPDFCLVDGQQVDYAEAATAASHLIDTDGDAMPSFGRRSWISAGLGLGAGVISGIAIGIVEAIIVTQGGVGDEAQVLWYGPLNYGALLGLIGLVVGALLALIPMDEEEIRGWTPTLATLATFIPGVLIVTLVRIQGAYGDQPQPTDLLAAVLGVAGVLTIALYFFAPRFFSVRLESVCRPGNALPALLVSTGLGIIASVAVLNAPHVPIPPPPIPAALADRPNVILVVVDSLRADQLSCYGGPIHTPAICSLVENGGTIFNGNAEASWTKPSTASILTSLTPANHGVTSKDAALPAEVTTISEVMKARGYVTGGVVSNNDLSPDFGFDQGYDEYHQLDLDTIVGAEESSSTLVLYNVVRSIVSRVNPSYRFGDFYQDSEVVNGVAFDFIAQFRRSRFFLFIHYMDPHVPYFEHPYNGHAVLPEDIQNPNPRQAMEIERLYKGEVEYLDANIQALLVRLSDFGVYDDTVIALVSGSGEEFSGDSARSLDSKLSEEQVRVPILVKWARNRVPTAFGGDARERSARLVDVVPTLAAQAGTAMPEAAQGLDLSTGFEAREEKDRTADHESGSEDQGDTAQIIFTQ